MRLAGCCILMSVITATACDDSGHGDSERTADLFVVSDHIWTGDPNRPQATAMAVRGDRIVAVGSEDELASWVGRETQRIDARDGMVVPGFIDAHVHFLTGGAGLASVQLRDAASPEEFVARIAGFAATLDPGEWILNGDWDHENWGGELPTREWVDSVTPTNPLMINRLDGHMVLANTRALELAGVDASTVDVAGGEILRDGGGYPTGILRDNAMALVGRVVPAASQAQLDRALRAASAYVASHGVTTVHDMADAESMATYRRALGGTGLDTRVYSVVPLSEWEGLSREVAEHGSGDEWLRIGGLKGFMDGSLGSHTAAFFEPFSDAPADRGLFVTEPDVIREQALAADSAGLQLIIHAIGDRAISVLLDIYGEVRDRHGPRDRRARIEHAQHVRPSDLRRFSELDVIASMQPYHAIDDGRWAERVIGSERAATTYAFRSLLDAGAHVVFGSDWFVAPPVPLLGIYAAVTRRTLDDANPDGWIPQQKITVDEALTAYTRAAAFSSFEEDLKGTLVPGLLADFVVLDRDITQIAPEEIRTASVLRTVVGGKSVYVATRTRGPG